MKNKFDFAFCMKRDCKVCNRYLECSAKTNVKQNLKKVRKRKSKTNII